MFEQPVLPIQDETTFAQILGEVEQAFAVANVDRFLRKVDQSRLRVRNFEGVLTRGLLGTETSRQYAALGDSDRGQVREQYLRMVEQVAPELRARYLKVYAYY